MRLGEVMDRLDVPEFSVALRLNVDGSETWVVGDRECTAVHDGEFVDAVRKYFGLRIVRESGDAEREFRASPLLVEAIDFGRPMEVADDDASGGNLGSAGDRDRNGVHCPVGGRSLLGGVVAVVGHGEVDGSMSGTGTRIQSGALFGEAV